MIKDSLLTALGNPRMLLIGVVSLFFLIITCASMIGFVLVPWMRADLMVYGKLGLISSATLFAVGWVVVWVHGEE